MRKMFLYQVDLIVVDQYLGGLSLILSLLPAVPLGLRDLRVLNVEP